MPEQEHTQIKVGQVWVHDNTPTRRIKVIELIGTFGDVVYEVIDSVYRDRIGTHSNIFAYSLRRMYSLETPEQHVATAFDEYADGHGITPDEAPAAFGAFLAQSGWDGKMVEVTPEPVEDMDADEAAMWERVSANILGDSQQPPEGPDMDEVAQGEPCVLCGSQGACAYDSEGRALIHATEDDDD